MFWVFFFLRLHVPCYFNRKETLYLDDERKQQFGISLPKHNKLIFLSIFSFLRAERLNSCCQDVATKSAFLWLSSVTEVDHAWWDDQLPTNLGWRTFDFAAIYLAYTIENFTSVKLKQNQVNISREDTGIGHPI